MENDKPAEVSPQNKRKLSISIDPRLLIIVLILIIFGMLFLWKPWNGGNTTNARTVSVTGEATIKAEPDEYVFYPSYQFTNADKQAAVDAATAKSAEIITKLKSLGVTDKQIKSSTNGYQNPESFKPTSTSIAPIDGTSGDYIYSVTLTITQPSRKAAQKVQDYLVTTGPTGAVTPQPSFSTAKRKQLESKARDEATKEARAKADQSAHNLGFKVGALKSVDDSGGFSGGPCGGGICLMNGEVTAKDSTAAATPALSVQPGENELKYSVTAVFYIK